MSDFLVESYEARVEKLLIWRNRYSKRDYPRMVVINMFYDLYPLVFMWEGLTNGFNQNRFWLKDKMNMVAEMLGVIGQQYRTIQMQTIQPNFFQLIKEIPSIAGLEYGKFQSLVASAERGNAQSIEEIEYSYIFYGCIVQSIMLWSALGISGHSKRAAFELVGELGIENPNFDNLDQTIQSFSHIMSYRLMNGFKKGNYIVGQYKKLPSLW